MTVTKDVLSEFTAIKPDHSNSTLDQPLDKEPGGGQPAPDPKLEGGPGDTPDPTPSTTGDPIAPDPAAPASPDPAAPADPDPAANPDDPSLQDPKTADPEPKKSSPFETIEESVDPDPSDPSASSEPDPEPESLQFQTLSERIGYEVESEDDVVQVFASLKAQDPFEGVSPLLKQAMEFEKGGGDVQQFLSILRIDVDGLSDRKALYEQFLVDNPDLANDQEYAQQKFDREYDSKYGILANEKLDVDFDSPEEHDAYKRDRDFAKKELEFNSKGARNSLSTKKDAALADLPSNDNAATSEETQIAVDNYAQESTDFRDSLETIQIPVDVEGKTVYNAALNDESRPMYEEWSKDPALFMDYIGIPSDGSPVDATLLNTHMALTAMLSVSGKSGFINLLQDAIIERGNSNTLEHQLENTVTPTRSAGPAGGGGQPSKAAEEIEAFRGLVAQEHKRS